MSVAANRSFKNADLLWRMSREGHDAACVMERTPVGLQAQFLIDGRMLVAYQFTTHAQVLTWATEKWGDLRARGWVTRGLYVEHVQPQGERVQRVA